MKTFSPVCHPWSAWSAWAPTIREIKEGIPPHRATIAVALRGDDPVPKEVREFLADLLDGKQRERGRPRSKNIIEQAVLDDFVRATFEEERNRISKTPKSQRDPGTPTEVGSEKAAQAVAKKGIVGKAKRPLSSRTIRKRAKRSDRAKRR